MDLHSNLPFIFLRDQEPLTDEEYEIVLDICSTIKDIVESRGEYVERNGLDPHIYMPQANWSLEGAFYSNYRKVLSGDRSVISNLRLFTQQFSGYCLYDLKSASGLHCPEYVPSEHDDTYEALSKQEDLWVKRYISSIKVLPKTLHLSPPRKFGEVGWLVNGNIVTHDTYVILERIALLYECGIIDSNPLSILEIGAGYGGLTHHLKNIFPQARFYIIDIPESLLFSASYLSVLHKDEENILITPKQINTLDKQGFMYIPNYMLHAPWNSTKFDLVINTLSMSEMSELQVKEYCRFIKDNLKEDGIFFEQNQDNRHLNFLDARDIIKDYFPFQQPLCGRYTFGLTEGSANIWCKQPISGGKTNRVDESYSKWLLKKILTSICGDRAFRKLKETLIQPFRERKYQPNPIFIEEDYKKYNILSVGQMYYGIAQSEGTFDIKKFKRGKYKYCFEAEFISEVKRLIDEAYL